MHKGDSFVLIAPRSKRFSALNRSNSGRRHQPLIPRNQRSGLRHAIEVLRDVEGVAFTFFNARDVVRHPLVQRIVQAYEAHAPDDRS